MNTKQEQQILEGTCYRKCTFGPDETDCDYCLLPNLQLYYQRTSYEYDEGKCVCLCCIAVEKVQLEAAGTQIDLEYKLDGAVKMLRKVRDECKRNGYWHLHACDEADKLMDNHKDLL